LFREYGEEYIEKYRPSLQQIKLIRAIRICKTEALGGISLTCKGCQKKIYLYKSCGHSQCMICQSIKREQWVDKLKNKLLKVPYVHAIFTLPHKLNGLARCNQSVVYAMVMKASWMTVNEVMKVIEAKPGMTMVLHTFGSDMKYHIHTHSLVTFGGLNKNGNWVYPKDKYVIAKYRKMCSMYKRIFLELLESSFANNEITYHEDYTTLSKEVSKLRWVVHTTYPTMNTELIENYLGRYVNRVAISNNRLNYLKENEEVAITYNEYKKQEAGKPAPKEVKILNPLVAVDQILQHVLPRHFQKSRNYGIHNACNKLKESAEEKIKANAKTIRTVFEIISHLMGLRKMSCSECEGEDFDKEEILPNKRFIYKFLKKKTRPPPNTNSNIKTNLSNVNTGNGYAMAAK
jgi:hypothetical protein